MLYFICGFITGSVILEPIIINLIYMRNPGLFLDIILTEKNRDKLEEEFEFEKRWKDCE